MVVYIHCGALYYIYTHDTDNGEMERGLKTHLRKGLILDPYMILMKPSVTPLRYPGGKTWLLDYVKAFIRFHKLDSTTIIEPYGGSASISVGLIRSQLVTEATVCEKDPLIDAFWNIALHRNEELIEYLSTLEINIETWYRLRKYLNLDNTVFQDNIEAAGAFLFYNRTNYSGIIKGGPLGGKKQLSKYKLNSRFNKVRIIDKIRNLKELEDKLKIIQIDGLEYMRYQSLQNPDNIFFYVDPPYYKAGKDLYRFYFTDFDHQQLSAFLTNTEIPWLLSYDDAEFIKNLYKKKITSPVYTDYQSGPLKRGIKELLISNLTIPSMIPVVLEVNNSISENDLEGY